MGSKTFACFYFRLPYPRRAAVLMAGRARDSRRGASRRGGRCGIGRSPARARGAHAEPSRLRAPRGCSRAPEQVPARPRLPSAAGPGPGCARDGAWGDGLVTIRAFWRCAWRERAAVVAPVREVVQRRVATPSLGHAWFRHGPASLRAGRSRCMLPAISGGRARGPQVSRKETAWRPRLTASSAAPSAR